MKIFSSVLAFIIFFSSTAPAFASDAQKTDQLILKLDTLSKNFEKNCISQKITDVEKYLKSYGLSESCWMMITEINELERQLASLHPQLQNKVNCSDCVVLATPTIDLPTLPVTEVPICSEADRKKIAQSCPTDLACTLVSTTLALPGSGSWIISPEKLFPAGMSPKNCTPGDSCTNQIVTAFYNSILSFFSSAWDLLKLAGGFAKDQLGDFWKWVTSAEDSSSAAQLALAQASEDESLFRMLKDDFTGTLGRIFQGLMSGMKEWLKNDILCEKWSGTPHRSTCQVPNKAFDCVSCKSLVNGMCAISGIFISEILPAFITGGLTTAAKHGAGAAGRLLKSTFKISDKSIKAIKNSKTLNSSLGLMAKADKVVKTSAVLAKINQYFISPARKVAKVAFNVLSVIVRNSKAYMAETAKGRYIVFAQDGLKMAGKVALYPIENNMSILAFKLGQRSFDKALKLAAPSLTNKTSVALEVTAHIPKLDSLLTKIEIAQIKKQKTLSMELEQVKLLNGKRVSLTQKALATKEPSFSEIVRIIYPELNYGELAKNSTKADLLLREKELYQALNKIPNAELKKSMLHKYQKVIVESQQRKALLKDHPNYKEIVDNANLSLITRGARGVSLLGKTPLNHAQRIKLEAGIRSASVATWDKKKTILLNSGFTEKEAKKLMDYGLVGLPPN